MKIIKIFFELVFAFSAVFAFSRESSRAHMKSVSNICASESGVFSAGLDGFLVKWNENDLGEHYQISELSVKKIAQNTNGNDIAVYETDGALFNRVSVWDWSKQRRKYSFIFNETVTSLSFSAQGTKLIVGTAAQNGIYIVNNANGKIEPRTIKDISGGFSYAQTGESEKSLVVYSPAGVISYYDIADGKQKAKFETVPAVSDIEMFGKSLFFAGIKNRSVVVMHAISGKTLGTFNAANAVLVKTSRNSDSIFYIENENRQFKIYKIQSENGRKVSEPALLRTFSGLKSGDKITSAAEIGGFIYAGTQSGNIYKFETYEMERVEVLQPITDDSFDVLCDIANQNEDCLVLSPAYLHLISFDGVEKQKWANSSSHTNVSAVGTDAILWTKGSRKAVKFVSLETGEEKTAFSPSGVITSLRIFEQSVITVESGSVVRKYNIFSGEKTTLYSGAGLQDAILVSGNDLYVAKTAATSPQSPLIHVDTQTFETVPLSLNGSFSYALDADFSNPKEIFGICVSENGGRRTTQVFAYDSEKKSSRTFLPINEEDTDAFLSVSSSNVYTNIGKSQARSLNLSTRRNFSYERGESMPLKIIRNAGKVAVLNRNGSVSFYKSENPRIVSSFYLNADGQWVEM